MQTSEFQQWTEESKMELESSCFDEMVKGVCLHQWVTKMLVIQENKWEHNNIF
jgi:hypothetical protein